MTPEEIKLLLSYAGSFGLGAILAGGLVWLLLKSFVPSYLMQKAENLATREDIAKITHEIERVKSQYAVLLEELKATHQLRLAAIDRRLQVHQEAFALWRELLGSTHSQEAGKIVMKCQDWWEKNCLYLEPKVRQAFVEAYSAAHTHHALVQSHADSKLISETWMRITKFPDIVFDAIQLPALSEIESKSLKIEKTDSSGK